ncbi:MAG: hypothetical protein ACR2L2_15935 [Acidobacteriota bacterium]
MRNCTIARAVMLVTRLDVVASLERFQRPARQELKRRGYLADETVFELTY